MVTFSDSGNSVSISTSQTQGTARLSFIGKTKRTEKDGEMGRKHTDMTTNSYFDMAPGLQKPVR